MHYNDSNYDGIVELIIYLHDNDDEPIITQVLSANNSNAYSLTKLLNSFEYLIPQGQIIEIGRNKFIRAIFSFNKEIYRYQFERLEKISDYQDEIFYLH